MIWELNKMSKILPYHFTENRRCNIQILVVCHNPAYIDYMTRAKRDTN